MPYTDRHPATAHFKPLFQYDHLPPDLQEISAAVSTLAEFAAHNLKDCLVRQAVIGRSAAASDG